LQIIDEQKEVFEEIMDIIKRDEGSLIFLDAPRGTGKTFLLNLILAEI